MITFTQNGYIGNINTTGWPNYSTNSSHFSNFYTPQLMGLIGSVAIVEPNPIKVYNQILRTRWCVMWTPYRLTLNHHVKLDIKSPATDTGSVWNRQLDSRQVYRVAIDLAGQAIEQDQAWQNVRGDPSYDQYGGHSSTAPFPRVLSVKLN